MASIQQKRTGVVLAAIGWVFIFVLTLYPAPDQVATADQTSVWCLFCGELGLVDVTLNVILFLPLGMGLGFAGWPAVRTFLAITLTTLTVEVLQLGIVTGRDASLSDLLTNTFGGLLGYLVARNFGRLVRLPPGRSLAVALGAAAFWIMVQAFTAFALQRTLPRSTWYGQWAADLAHLEQFTGEVRSVHLGDMPLPGHRLPASARVRTALLSPGSVLEVRATSGAPTLDLAPIFSIFDDRQREIVLVGQDGDDLVFRIRTRTRSFGLRSPALRLPDALPDNPGARLELRASYQPGRYLLEAEVDSTDYRGELALSASWGWTFLLPFDYAFGPETPWLTMLWVGGLLFPAGFYAARSGILTGPQAAAGLAGILAVGLLIVPLLGHLAIVQPLEWGAAGLGSLGGWRGGRLAIGD